jgi:hypothetical protein
MSFHMLILLIVLPSFTSEQQPLRLNPAEISEVIAEVCSETTTNANPSIAPSRLTTQSRQPSADVAFSVLIKLVIDMYKFMPFSLLPHVVSSLAYPNLLGTKGLGWLLVVFSLTSPLANALMLFNYSGIVVKMSPSM